MFEIALHTTSMFTPVAFTLAGSVCCKGIIANCSGIWTNLGLKSASIYTIIIEKASQSMSFIGR